MNYKQSLIGFHNPYLHKNLTASEFLDRYIESQKKRFRKKDGYKRKKLVDWIEKNKDSQLNLFIDYFHIH